MIISTGIFEGRGGHVLSGDFALHQSSAGLELVTADNFFFDGSPAPGFALFQGDPSGISLTDLAEAAQLSGFLPLPSNMPVSGQQRGYLHPGAQRAPFDHIFLWCFEFPFLLGQALIVQAE